MATRLPPSDSRLLSRGVKTDAEIASVTILVSFAALTKGNAPILLDRAPRKRVQEIRKDIDETLDLFPAVLVKLTFGGIPIVSSIGTRRNSQKLRAVLLLPWEAPE